MARNGSGTYSLAAGNPVVTSTTISSTTHNNTMTDIETALTDSLTANGEKVWSGTQDANGNKIILDVDADTSITADTDDQIDIEIAGADDFQFTANTFTALSGSAIATNTINETTAASGVTIDSVLIKDGAIDLAGDTAAGDNASAGYTATEGLVLTGQGSTNDVTIKNDADETVISILTGTQQVKLTSSTALERSMTWENTDPGANGVVWVTHHNSASPAASDKVFIAQHNGEDSAGGETIYAGYTVVIEDPSNGSEDGYMEICTIDGGTSNTEQIRFGKGCYHSSATGGAKGVNTLNMGTLYSNGTENTVDWVLDLYVDGEVDPKHYNHRQWETFDKSLFDVDAFTKSWLTRRALPAFLDKFENADEEKRMSVDYKVQALIETVELQAIHIENLNQRLKALE